MLCSSFSLSSTTYVYYTFFFFSLSFSFPPLLPLYLADRKKSSQGCSPVCVCVCVWVRIFSNTRAYICYFFFFCLAIICSFLLHSKFFPLRVRCFILYISLPYLSLTGNHFRTWRFLIFLCLSLVKKTSAGIQIGPCISIRINLWPLVVLTFSAGRLDILESKTVSQSRTRRRQ